MRFSYTGLISLAPDTGEPTAIFRPEIPITIYGPLGSREIVALVDTGADNTILPEAAARALGIPLVPARGPAARAFGGQAISLSYADVEVELVHSDAPLRWTAQVFFMSMGADDETVVLGHQGFLEYFTAMFIGDECVLDLVPNADLPKRPVG